MGFHTREAIENYIAAANKSRGEFLLDGRRGRDQPITTRQYARLVSHWIASIGLDPLLSVAFAGRTGNLRAVSLLLDHKQIESAVRYLGIEVDDALAIAEQIDV